MSTANTKPKLKQTTIVPGVIEPHALYTVDEVRRRLRIGQWAWRQWRNDGLIVLRVSGRAFVTGRALIDFIELRGRDSAIDSQSNGQEGRPRC